MTRQPQFTSNFPRLALLLSFALAPACNGGTGNASDTDATGTTTGTTTDTTGTTTGATTDTTGTEPTSTSGTTAVTTTTDPITTTDTTAGPTATSETTDTTGTTDTTDTTDGTTGTTDTTDTTDTGGALSFQTDVYPILMANCSCHTGGGAGGLALPNAQTAYDNLIDVPSVHDANIDRVEPGDADNSFFYQKIAGAQDGISPANAQMPKSPGQAMSNNPLSPADQTLIADWIAQGAVF